MVIVEHCRFGGNFGVKGGAIYTRAGTLDISNTHFEANLARHHGGGIWAESGSGIGRGVRPILNLADVTFKANMGGAFYAEGAIVTLERIEFLDNIMDSQAMGGGALLCIGTEISVVDCVFKRNQQHQVYSLYYDPPSYGGGAISLWRSTLDVENTEFTRNIAANEGGVIDSWDSSMEITDCVFTMNGAGESGGVIDMGLGELLIRNSVFTNNHAGGDGGGIRTLKVGAIIRDSAFDGQVWSHLAAAH